MDFSQMPPAMFTRGMEPSRGMEPPRMDHFTPQPRFQDGPYSGQMVVAPPASNGIMAFCRSHSSVLMVLAAIVLALVIGVLVYRARNKVMGDSGPYSDIITSIKDPEIKSDAQEVQYLFQIAKRPNIKVMLRETIESFKDIGNGSAGKERIKDHGSYDVVGMSAEEAQASGDFEPV